LPVGAVMTIMAYLRDVDLNAIRRLVSAVLPG
jgi:hypothetical protein